MTLKIETFTNADHRLGWRPGNNAGGNCLFKAIGHPKASAPASALARRLGRLGRIAVYDPEPAPALEAFAGFYDLGRAEIAGVFVQRLEDVGQERLGLATRPITELKSVKPDALFISAFDAKAYHAEIAPYLPNGLEVLSLDAMRLPEEWLSNRRRYLDPLNFATNFAFFRDQDTLHTRIVSVNYWTGYGAEKPALWLCLFDADGKVLAEWHEDLAGANSVYVIDSREVRARFALGPFAGSLFMHALRAKGHDVVKYALDVFSDDGVQLSSTHDANAWPADLYAGVPAPEPGEKLVLWVQNSHPLPIPKRAIGVNAVGSQHMAWLDAEIPAFGTRPVDLGELLPDLRWPAQIELQAGRHFVRPRYEILAANGRLRIAHANVERTDLSPDPMIPKLAGHMGKGYIMPLPVPPIGAFSTLALPTPMATSQRELPIEALLFDASGEQVAERSFGRIARRQGVALDVDRWLQDTGARLPSGYGHLEYVYDFRDGGEADGWLHAIGRYRQRTSGHAADTSFGAHIFNVPIVYRDEPQSYAHRPPGLSTRLFLRLGSDGADTLCHLIYPASLPWRAHSQTRIILCDARGREIAERQAAIPCGGSYYWRYCETFSGEERSAAGPNAYVTIRDLTCRLFGYHGLINGEVSFSLDHMFGF